MRIFSRQRVSGIPPHPRLKREITGILVIKLSLILLAGFTIFGARHRLPVDMNLMTNRFFGNTLSSASQSAR